MCHAGARLRESAPAAAFPPYDLAVRIDHVLLASGDIEESADRLLSRYGLESVRGGEHPQWGTGNRIVPLGGQYLEIIGVTDPARAAGTDLGRWVAASSSEGDALAGFMVEPDDFEATCARLLLAQTPGARTLPDGTSLSWRLAGLSEAITQGLPCFITWDGRGGALGGLDHDPPPDDTGIAWVEVGGDPDVLREWVGGDVDALQLVGGAPGIRRLAVRTASQTVILDERP